MFIDVFIFLQSILKLSRGRYKFIFVLSVPGDDTNYGEVRMGAKIKTQLNLLCLN